MATCDRLLADLDRGTERLDGRTVLVVDEAGMLGSRKLARLLEHAQQARAKVVLVGDDRQLAAIDAGGGFRALRLRLGASELTENRRQHQAWEREALELVRSGLVEEAVAAYRAHDRVVAAESKPAATLALLQDWWQAYQEAERDPAQDVIVLAGRRVEVDRLNVACQELLAARGRLGPDRLQVEDLQLAVGDRVVCGRNAIGQLGVANGTRGTVTALDPEARTLTIRVDGKEPREVTLPGWYLDGRQRGERNRRVDLAYATTGHRAQGLTRWRALVRLTGGEDANWLYVQLSRARHQTTLYPVVGPEPQGPAELDLPDRDVGDGYDQLAQALSRAGDQTLAIDTQSSLDLRRLSTRELRAERDRLRQLLDQAPQDRARELDAGGRPPGRGRPGPGTAHHQQRSAAPWAGDASPTPPRPSRPRPTGPPPWWPASRPTAPTTLSWRCAAISSAGPAGWRPTRTSARPTARWSGSWPGSAGPAAWPPSTNHPPTFARSSGRSPRAPGGGGPGDKPPPPSRTTAAPTRSPTPTTRSARLPREPAQRVAWQHARQAIARVQGRQRRPDRDRQSQRDAASHPSPVDRDQQDQPPARSGRMRSRAGRARSEPPASTTRRPPWPGNLTPNPTASGPPVTTSSRGCRSGPSARPTWPPCSPTSTTTRTSIHGSGGSEPVVAVRVRASVGQPGASAAAEYQRRRATELATWARSLPWRIVALVAAGVAAWLAAAPVVPDLATPAGVTVAAGLGWLLRFRSSPDTVAWRRGAVGKRRTARLLAPLERRGWAVLHDLAIPQLPGQH